MYKKQADDNETTSASVIAQLDGINPQAERTQHPDPTPQDPWMPSGGAAMDDEHQKIGKWLEGSGGSHEDRSDAADCADAAPAHSACCAQLKPLSHQVAGHVDGKKKGLGMRQHPDGSVLKHVQPPPRGQREVDFYKTVFNAECKDERIIFLREQVPRFMGTWIPPNSPNTVYLKLEDVTCKFNKPCIMDVKMGRQSYDPCASQEKVDYERTKYPLMQEIGFLVLGMRVYQPETNTDVVYDKFFGRSLETDNLKEGISKFFHNGHCLRLDALEGVIQRLENIYTWFQQQRIWNFYSSSLLMVYEGNAPPQTGHSTRTTSPATCESEAASRTHDGCTHSRVFGCERDPTLAVHPVAATEATCQEQSAEPGPIVDVPPGSIGLEDAIIDNHFVKLCTSVDVCQPNVYLLQTSNDHTQASYVFDSCLDNTNAGCLCRQVAEPRTKDVHRDYVHSVGTVRTGRQHVDVKLIDFAHAFISEEADEGYIYGLNNLIAVLREILEKARD
ncbi:inositol polyphosphate multikinase isoform X1 [Lethenteron reissneri]|uniref:inositol polyphosphate multikinase isoform X1 n=2 Tax=Lethenteron reissneri TaxID=7753 RepID=UPI002AB7D012|nr:inositol polyphosphate multikinase isoform X1 [Lethenteron reissneri]XP_061421337.1 inositol polyphosphate multikinase isoform X1 [Lethenteron reissneri]XP_061421338.1 inositol polyphosphate multikinase isoform X1 [Lethenteron reissneri]